MAYTPSCMHMALLQALSILLLASVLVPGSAEEAPSGYRIELIHVDANGGFTREELIRRAVDRTHLRAAMLSATDDTNSPASSGTYSFAVHYSSYEYLMKLEIGTPPEPFLAVADTGSDLVWTKQLKLCASSTFTHGSCSDSPPNCKSCPAGAMCDTCFDELCMFKKRYGRHKKTAKGFLGRETLTLSTDKKVIAIGCAINWSNSMLPESADGIVGLNLGPMSLVKQLEVTKFSYCLNNQLTPQLSSPLWFGDDLRLSAGAGGRKVQTTPLVQIPTEQTSVWANKYYVELHQICINDKCESLQKDDFKFKSVMFVDSGVPRTLLEKTVFGVLKGLLSQVLGVESVLKPFPNSSGKEKILTCFEPPAPPSKLEMVLNFTAQAEMRLPWDNYMEKRGSDFCLAIYENSKEKSISVLGNFQQQNIHMLYDLTAENLQFVQDVDCSKL